MHIFLIFVVLGLGTGAAYALIGIGLVSIHKASGVVNFAAGAVAALGAFIYTALADRGWPPALSLITTLTVTAALGAVVYVVIMRPLRGAPLLARVVATLGILLLLEGYINLFFSQLNVTASSLLPVEAVSVFGITVGQNRLWLFVIALVITSVISVVYRYSLFGILTRGVSESEKGVTLLGKSPDRLAAMNWALSFALAGLAGVLISSFSGLQLLSLIFLIVPALAAAMFGGFKSFWITSIAAILIGVVQSEAIKYWTLTGAGDAVPFVVLILALFIAGKAVPNRGIKSEGRVPLATRGRPSIGLGVVVMLALIGLFTMPSNYQASLITSMAIAIVALSLVVVTGYSGQVSLVQFTFAGVGGFVTAKFAEHHGWPFPLPMIMAMIIVGACGFLLGIPALRIRGINLAIVTLGAAVVINSVVFNNSSWTGGISGLVLPNAKIGNFSLAPYPDAVRFGIMTMVILALAAMGVAWMRNHGIARRMLSVRENERATAAAGWSITRIKLLAFTLSAALAALGGSLLAYQQGDVVFSEFGAFTSVLFFAYVYLAGIGSIGGALLAGFAAPGGLLSAWLQGIFHSSNVQNWMNFVFAFGLLFSIIKQPDGVAPIWHEQYEAIKKWLRRRVSPEAEGEHVSAADPRTVVPRLSSADRAQYRSDEVILSTENLSVRFGGVVAVDGLSVSLKRGAITGLIGPNGAGKTTAVDGITGFVRSQGVVRFNDIEIGGFHPAKRARLGLSRTFQSVELITEFNVYENVALSIHHHGRTKKGIDYPETAVQVNDALAAVGMLSFVNAPISELSTGQLRLLSVARALAGGPQFLALDEPAAGLDLHEREAITDCISQLPARGISVLLIEHDIDLIFGICDHVIVLENGRKIAEGAPEEVRKDRAVAAAYLGDIDDAPMPPGIELGSEV